MFRRITLIGAIIAVLVAVLPRLLSQPSPPFEHVQGRNNTVLFLALEHNGLSNVHLATTQALLEQYPDIKVHFASYPKLAKKLPRLTSFAQRREPKAQEVSFHLLVGLSYFEAIKLHGEDFADEDGHLSSVQPPGLAGVKQLARSMQRYLAPWSAEDHLALHDNIGKIIDEVDPAVVVLDTLFMPAIEATRGRKRLHAFITPNTLLENFVGEQPWLGMLWKYPALPSCRMGSGFPFPVPWRQIPLNAILNARIISSLTRMPDVAAKRTFLKEHGVLDPIKFYGTHRADVPWVTQTLPGASVPMEYVPANVTCTGPIVLSAAPAEEQDPEFSRWMQQKPTILINLGSGFSYSITQMRQMISAIPKVLEDTDLQVLWKVNPSENLTFDWEEAAKPLTDTGRVKVSRWLSVDPSALLESGHISLSVTHGGSGGYHEGIAAGVPQVVLPLWLDLYNFAQLVEQIGVGVWGCRESSPSWTPECLSEAIIRVVASNESSTFRENAQKLGKVAQNKPGREVAAQVIAKLARSGRA
ncbi:UDP-Glycosyltransferase/glycogen phosphorylase [Thozetella sp. PMI_491]|nr:UDP-Glycosyltransferase/glycogen phosphorylase [Thozetella sp. PMI_491]